MTDFSQRTNQIHKIITYFNENSQRLYNSPGILSIDVTESGFKFNIEIERSKSFGVNNMKIFCYDLMLARLWAEIKKEDVTLIHDSILFADVDERQKALALELAAEQSEKYGFQYICMLNSDNLPINDFSKDFDIEKYVRIKLGDKGPKESLLGMRV